MSDLRQGLVSLIYDSKHTRWIAPCLVAFEAVLCAAIIWKIPYTEIDWETYMVQVSKFLPPNSITDYSRLDGPTGPLVYPAGHVWIHSALYYITDHGRDIRLAQIIYAGLYLCTLSIVLACYSRVNAPPWLLAPLVLSKRLHSIFLLRMFGDCWTTFFFWLMVYCATRRSWTGLTAAWTTGLSTKMTMLLPMPAVAVILIQGAGMEKAVGLGIMAWILQFAPAIPFFGNRKELLIYLGQAFDLSRQFLYKWTVNWRFVPEEIFLSRTFAYSLLGLHAVILLVFLERRWVLPSSTGLVDFVQKQINYQAFTFDDQKRHSKMITPFFVMDALLGSIAIGMLCARSLHYQFFAYLAWSTPYLLWRLSNNPFVVLPIWLMQELAWLTYPSTRNSSLTVVLILILQVNAVWRGLSVASMQTGSSQKKVH